MSLDKIRKISLEEFGRMFGPRSKGGVRPLAHTGHFAQTDSHIAKRSVVAEIGIMDLLTNAYDEDSNTPKRDQNKEDSSIRSPHLQTSGKHISSTAAPVDTIADSSESEDSSSDEIMIKTAHRSSDSSRESGTSVSSPTGSDRSDVSKTMKELAAVLRDKRLPSSSKVSTRRSRSRSASREREHRPRRSFDRRRHSRSRDRHHKTSHSEKKLSYRSRSRSRSRDRRSRHHGRDHRRRDGHRRHHSSRDGHRHRRRSSSSHRHRHRSRSPEHKSYSEKKRRSHSPRPSSSSKSEQAPTTIASTSAATTGSSRPPVLKMSGVKRGRDRGANTGTFKDIVKEEYMQNAQRAESAMFGNTPQALMGPSQMASIAATVSAGTGVKGGGGVGQVLFDTLHTMHMQQQQQGSNMRGQLGCLTQEQKVRNQKLILESTGRTREQVEAQYGVKIPSIYNENTNNMVQLAEREKKRNALFGKQKSYKRAATTTTSAFNALPILPGESKSDNLKFARLMGCRKRMSTKEDAEQSPDDASETEAAEKAYRENKIRSDNLQKEYDSSRQFTHFARGSGLGYSATVYQPR